MGYFALPGNGIGLKWLSLAAADSKTGNKC
jgi:hypothetical protein